MPQPVCVAFCGIVCADVGDYRVILLVTGSGNNVSQLRVSDRLSVLLGVLSATSSRRLLLKKEANRRVLLKSEMLLRRKLVKMPLR